ncbi:MAG: cytosine permease [Actinomycetota bacterium]
MSAIERAGAPPEWGIDPVPPEERVLGSFDLAILWGDLGIGLLVLVTGALLVPGLGIGPALAAVVVGSVIGVALLALAGVAGAAHGVPTMALFRPILGVRGSWLPSVLNAAQLVGWTAVEFWAMSFVADLVVRRVFGFSARPLWLLLAALACTGLALWGPVGVTRTWMKRFSAWIVIAIALALTLLLLTSGAISAALGAPATGSWPSFGGALDLVIAMPISWLPLVADYNRFARGRRPAFTGTFVGYLVANIWLYALGALLVLGEGVAPTPAGIAAGILALAGGSLAGLLFLVALLVGETDEAFADMYSGAISVRNIVPSAPQDAVIVALAVLATILAGWLSMARYESFLFLLGSVFVPLFGILTARYFVPRRDQRRPQAVEARFAEAMRTAAVLAWIVGFAAYHWVAPSGPQWWLDLVAAAFGDPLGARVGWLPASLVSFGASFLLAAPAARRSRTPSAL